MPAPAATWKLHAGQEKFRDSPQAGHDSSSASSRGHPQPGQKTSPQAEQMPSSYETPVPQPGQRNVAGLATTGSGSPTMYLVLGSSGLTLVCLKGVAAVGARVRLRWQILTAIRAGEEKLGPAFRTYVIIGAKGGAAVGTEVSTAR